MNTAVEILKERIERDNIEIEEISKEERDIVELAIKLESKIAEFGPFTRIFDCNYNLSVVKKRIVFSIEYKSPDDDEDWGFTSKGVDSYTYENEEEITQDDFVQIVEDRIIYVCNVAAIKPGALDACN